MVNRKQHAIFVRHIKVKNLMVMPGSAFKFMDVQRRMTPIVRRTMRICVSHALNFGRKQCKFFFEADCATENHKSLTMSSIDS